jgi:hypothetical protein
LASGAALTIPALLSPASALGTGPAWTAPATPTTTAPFNECPQVSVDTGCAVLIVLGQNGTVTFKFDPTQAGFDSSGNNGHEDTLVGVLNQSGTSIPSFVLTSTLDIYGFDGDGVCADSNGNLSGTLWKVAGSPVSNSCPYGTTGYEGPGVSFTNINAGKTSGTVNFANGLGSGKSAFFSLEHSVTGGSLTVPTLTSFTTSRSASSVVYGTSVTDTATAVGTAGSPGTPAGTVSFYVCGPTATTCTSTANPVGSAVTLAGSAATSTAQATYTPSAVGSYCFYAVYTGTNYLSTADTGTQSNSECFSVTPAPLTITASSETVSFGKTPPAPTPSYSGFVGSDSASSLTTPPSCTTTATSSSPAGTYPSTCSGAVDANYAITYVPGTVTVTGAPVVNPPTAAASSTPPPKPVPSATVVHTGEPWAGSRPLLAGAAGAGLGLLGLGLVRRRRHHLAARG